MKPEKTHIICVTICENPTVSGFDLAFDIVKYFVFNLLIVCVGRRVLAQYYLQIFTICTALMLKLKIHTRARIVPMWAIKLYTV